MDKKEAILQLESLRADCKEFESVNPTEKDVQALEIALAALKETAQEVPVQEQLSTISKNFKFIQVSQTIYFTLIIVSINLMINRFDKSFQGVVDIFQGTSDVTTRIIDILQTITNIIT
ncbi:hypothetical protein [Clostridium culturomicium]|uniref:hypothetical protein n=1 Tax=Clostridium culturomicium TaxID=1499683 RepID=UPI0011DE44FB|nr:hypothetical protein [Clostridium culturomicium]